MPFTLTGQILKSFIFGAAMCKIVPYFQGEFYYGKIVFIESYKVQGSVYSGSGCCQHIHPGQYQYRATLRHLLATDVKVRIHSIHLTHFSFVVVKIKNFVFLPTMLDVGKQFRTQSK